MDTDWGRRRCGRAEGGFYVFRFSIGHEERSLMPRGKIARKKRNYPGHKCYGAILKNFTIQSFSKLSAD
jgi:hypothetical protein